MIYIDLGGLVACADHHRRLPARAAGLLAQLWQPLGDRAPQRVVFHQVLWPCQRGREGRPPGVPLERRRVGAGPGKEAPHFTEGLFPGNTSFSNPWKTRDLACMLTGWHVMHAITVKQVTEASPATGSGDGGRVRQPHPGVPDEQHHQPAPVGG